MNEANCNPRIIPYELVWFISCNETNIVYMQQNFNDLNPDDWVYHGWFELVLKSLGYSSKRSRKHTLRDIFGIFSHFVMKMYAVCAHQNYLREAILMSTLNIPLFYRRAKWLFYKIMVCWVYSLEIIPIYLLSLRFSPQWLGLPMSRTNFQRATGVRLYIITNINDHILWSYEMNL